MPAQRCEPPGRTPFPLLPGISAYIPDGLKTADAIILSHGRLDHCGKLPVTIRNGFRGPVYCTPATGAAARIVLNDSARIQEENADYLNQRSRGPGKTRLKPLYTSNDIAPVLKQFKSVNYGQKTDLGKGVSFTFFDAGHILGSAYVVLEWTEAGPEAGRNRSLLFTADVGRYDAPILRDPQTIPFAVDQFITESTYGNTRHAPIAQVGPELLECIQYCISRKSRILIPSFAVGRTQTVLWYVQQFIAEKKIPPIPVFIDSPMGVEQPNDMVVFVGWIPPQTLGRKLQDGFKRVRIFDRFYAVNCQIRTIHGLSAHADGDELLRFLGPTLKPETTAYVVHGEVPQAEAFAARWLKAGVGRAMVPAMESSIVSGEAPAVAVGLEKGMRRSNDTQE